MYLKAISKLLKPNKTIKLKVMQLRNCLAILELQ